jgi:hypothetical protein
VDSHLPYVKDDMIKHKMDIDNFSTIMDIYCKTP